ncbi:MAG: tetratricopeptide repeat protein [Acidobacteria bacterium]|nr:tetratricopeptide repeat protein [Acidobacteriota bacterium]
MANDAAPLASGTNWEKKQVFVMASVCLVVGMAIGYLFRGSQPAAPPAASAGPAETATRASMAGGRPTLEQMKQMADKKAEPLLEKLKSDPNNSALLNQVALVYKSTHQFKEAASYFDKALQSDPKNVAIRTDLASCLYYNGDVEEAIAQLNQSLHDDPKDANTLFNLGMIKWQGKQDGKGAVAAWQELLKSNPQLSADRKAAVKKLIAGVQAQGKS